MPVTAETYERVAQEDPEGRWELVCGQLRSKGAMTTEHGWATVALDRQLQRQVDEAQFSVQSNNARLRVSNGNFFVPDVCVVPLEMVRRLLERPGTFEVYNEPVPFVAEVWSPSTGEYDEQTKLREYQLRGDREIWLIHPYERAVRVYLHAADAESGQHRYRETRVSGGSVELSALASVFIDVARLFP